MKNEVRAPRRALGLPWLLAALLLGCSSSDDASKPGNVGIAGAGAGGLVTGGTTGGAATGVVGGAAGIGVGASGAAGNGGNVPVGGAAPQGGVGAVPATGGVGPAGAGTGTGGSVATPTSGVWSHMGYDERNWYFNPTETTLSVDNAASLTEKWRFMVGGFPPGTPVVGEGKVFVMATGGTYGINLADGTMAWARTDLAGTASVAYEPGFVYVHTALADLYKLNAADGTTVWGPEKSDAQPNCDGTSSPVLAGGKVLVGHSCGVREVTIGMAAGAKGGVEAHDAATGAKAWSYSTVEGGEDGAMVWSTVGVDMATSTVYAGSGNNYTVQGANSDSIHAIDLATGMRRWKSQVRNNDLWSFDRITGPDTDFGANPIIADIGGQATVACGDKGSAFWALDRNTGAQLWSREGLSPSRDQAHGGILMNGAFDGTNFYMLVNTAPGGTTTLYAIPATGGAEAWKNDYPKLAWGAPSVANGVLVAPVDDDLYVLNAATGAQLTMFNTGGTIAAGAAAIVDGKVIVSSGLQYALDATAKNNNQIICYGLP